MTYKIEFLPRARKLLEAWDWYDDRRSGLGDRFMGEIEKKSLNKPVDELAVAEDSPSVAAHHRLSRTTIETDSSELVIRFKDGLTCPECGSSKIKHTGSCATCLNCGASLGCS